MGLLPIPKPTGNAAPEAAAEGVPPDPSKYVDDEEGNVSPEEQKQYDEFMNNALNVMYTEQREVNPAILEALNAGPKESEEGPDPGILALAQSAVNIVGKLDDSSREAGHPVSDDVLYHGAIGVIEELAEIARSANIRDFSEEEMQGALFNAIDMYRPKLIESGRTTEETLKGQFSEIADADKAGKLGDVLPGLGAQTVGEAPVQAEQ